MFGSESSIALPVLITVGSLFLVGLLADLVGRHTPLPRVTLLLLSGFLIGPSMLDLLPAFTDQWFPVFTDLALAMIGFLLGQNFTRARLSELGRVVLTTSLGKVLATVLLMFLGLSLLGVPVEVALLLAGIASATAPAATVDVVHECQARGEFSDTLLGVVAIDDAWALLAFTILMTVAQTLTGEAGVGETLIGGFWEVGGALILGLLVGMPMAYVTGRLRPGEPTQAEALGVVILTAGLAEWLGVSYILATMMVGTVVANLAKHHERPFREIEDIEWPFLIFFFLLAGTALHVEELRGAGTLVGGYIVLRIAGSCIGAWAGGVAGNIGRTTGRWIGFALLPQAGVAIGMALVAADRFPEVKEMVLPVVLGSTVIFEVAGPIITRWTLSRVGEIQR